MLVAVIHGAAAHPSKAEDEQRTLADPVRLPVLGKGKRIELRVLTRVTMWEEGQGELG